MSRWDPEPVLQPQQEQPQPHPVPDQSTMHARRLHVSRLPPTASVLSLASFFNGAMLAVGGTTGAVVSVCIDFIKKYALVEMRTVEEAKAVMLLDGLSFEGYPVVVRRPRDFNHYAA